MPDPRTILADVTAELMERGVQPRPLSILAHAAERGLDEATIEALAELLAEAEAVAA
jgi:hypothetical protein